jgi:alkylated DNA repair dioxygenase AlkB
MLKINAEHGYDLDICFLNLYLDQHKALGWHSDDSHTIDQTQPIAVVSFGAEREIWVKPKGYKGNIMDDWKQPLANGSLFIMPEGFQDDYLHKIPKNDRECGARVSLTFRKYLVK